MSILCISDFYDLSLSFNNASLARRNSYLDRILEGIQVDKLCALVNRLVPLDVVVNGCVVAEAEMVKQPSTLIITNVPEK
jgi:hypothetical protein